MARSAGVNEKIHTIIFTLMIAVRRRMLNETRVFNNFLP